MEHLVPKSLIKPTQARVVELKYLLFNNAELINEAATCCLYSSRRQLLLHLLNLFFFTFTILRSGLFEKHLRLQVLQSKYKMQHHHYKYSKTLGSQCTIYVLLQKQQYSLKLLTKLVHINKPVNHTTSEEGAIWLRSKPPLNRRGNYTN